MFRLYVKRGPNSWLIPTLELDVRDQWLSTHTCRLGREAD